jgi:PilZ domain
MDALETLSARSACRESRRDSRFVTPSWELEIEGRRLTSVNWSLGGFLVRGELPLEIGDIVTGTLRAPGSDGFTFAARLVRRERGGRGLGFALEELIPLALSRMDDAASDFGRPG